MFKLEVKTCKIDPEFFDPIVICELGIDAETYLEKKSLLSDEDFTKFVGEQFRKVYETLKT